MQETRTPTLLEQLVLETAQASTAEEALRVFLRLSAQALGWPLGHVFYCSGEGQAGGTPEETTSIRSSGLWFGTKGGDFEAFTQRSGETGFSPQQDLPGRAATAGAAVWVSDLGAESEFDRHRQARACGIVSGYALPLIAGGKTVAIAEYFATTSARVSPQAAEICRAMAAVIAPRIALDVLQGRRETGSPSGAVGSGDGTKITPDFEGPNFREVQRLARVAIYTCDLLDKRCGCGFKVLTEMMGSLPETLNSRCVFDDDYIAVIHPADREGYRQAVEQARSEGRAYSIDLRMADGQNGYRDWRETTTPISDESGSVVGLLGIVQDITDLKRTERALADSEGRFRSIFENSPASIVLKDPDGHVRLANRTFLERYGFEPEDVIGKTFYDFFPAYVADTSTKHDREVLESGLPAQYELELEWRDGKQHKVLINKFPVFDSQGRTMGAATITEEITALKEAERKLHQAQHLEALGQLTGGIAHDFNNLLAVILNHAELMGEEGSAASGSVKAITRAANRGAELTQRLLAFSRRQSLETQTVDLTELFTGLVEILGRTLEESIEITTTIPEKLWRLDCDPGQLENALLNLVINSSHAMPEGGKISCQARNVTIGEGDGGPADLDPGDYVEILVRDSGQGIPTENLARVFEPFFTTKDPLKGSGLGLSMVYGFAKQSGGDATIESQTGKGTAVRLYLPRARATRRPCAPSQPVQDDRGGSETVLVLEDDSAVRELTVTMLERLGYTVLQAENGRRALEIVDEVDDISLLLSDVVLPGGMSGPATAEKLLESKPDIAVVFMSGYTEKAESAKHPLLREYPLLKKPFRKSQLADILRQALDGSAQA